MEGTFENHLDGKLFYETLARILGEQYNVKLTVTVKLRDTAEKTEDNLTA